jgi:hypothetical protein
VDRDLGQVGGEVAGRVVHLLCAIIRCRARGDALLVAGEGLRVDRRHPRALLRIGDDEEVPALAIRAARGLERERQALLDQLVRDGAFEVEAPAHSAGRRQELVRGEHRLLLFM